MSLLKAYKCIIHECSKIHLYIISKPFEGFNRAINSTKCLKRNAKETIALPIFLLSLFLILLLSPSPVITLAHQYTRNFLLSVVERIFGHWLQIRTELLTEFLTHQHIRLFDMLCSVAIFREE